LIDKVLNLSDIMVETPGRDMNRNQIWSVSLNAITSKLSIKDETPNFDGEYNGQDEELLSAALTETQEIRATGNKANEYCDDDNNEMHTN
jgi:hypothetical protein